MFRNEYPRPQFERAEWINLNGEWNFSFDDQNEGLKNKWFINHEHTMKINVPYTYQCKLSGIDIQDFHDIVWYQRDVELSEELLGKHLKLNFGAVDYKADIWLNGQHIATHEGGHSSFTVDITNEAKLGTNSLVLRVEDYTHDLELPRGKQYWKERSESIFYTRTTGIWQSVWLEPTNEVYLSEVLVTPNLDEKKVMIEYELSKQVNNAYLQVVISLNGIEISDDLIKIKNARGKRDIWLDQEVSVDWNIQESWVWSPENPVLFDIEYRLIIENQTIDYAKSYFGLRKVEIVDGKFLLNNRPYYQRLILDQGYWEDALLTAPTDEDFIKDIKLTKEMGFNGVRKHQKVEDPRYLYLADKLGLLVWGEVANAYTYSRKYVNRITSEWMEVIKRDYNHPCIVAWTPLNESWGVDFIMNNKAEQAHSAAMYWLTKSLDQTRLVISNDGWEQTQTDLLTIHDYEFRKDVLNERYSTIENILKAKPAGRKLFANNWEYANQPIIISEMGGISYQKSSWEGWGYSAATSDEDFIQRYYDVIKPMYESEHIQGFCYTQISDVEQEINGLLTYRREPKVSLDIIRAITTNNYQK